MVSRHGEKCSCCIKLSLNSLKAAWEDKITKMGERRFSFEKVNFFQSSSLEEMPQHLLIVEDDSGRREFVLDETVYSIGRDDRCDIKLNSQFVSRRHAMLVQLLNDNGTDYYRIVDGNLKGKSSANGLLINGRKLQSYDLEHEDEVVFGPQVRCLYYRIGESHNDEFGWEDKPPPDSDAASPRHPYPLTPSTGAEALPDQGLSQTP